MKNIKEMLAEYDKRVASAREERARQEAVAQAETRRLEALVQSTKPQFDAFAEAVNEVDRDFRAEVIEFDDGWSVHIVNRVHHLGSWVGCRLNVTQTEAQVLAGQLKFVLDAKPRRVFSQMAAGLDTLEEVLERVLREHLEDLA